MTRAAEDKSRCNWNKQQLNWTTLTLTTARLNQAVASCDKMLSSSISCILFSSFLQIHTITYTGIYASVVLVCQNFLNVGFHFHLLRICEARLAGGGSMFSTGLFIRPLWLNFWQRMNQLWCQVVHRARAWNDRLWRSRGQRATLNEAEIGNQNPFWQDISRTVRRILAKPGRHVLW